RDLPKNPSAEQRHSDDLSDLGTTDQLQRAHGQQNEPCHVVPFGLETKNSDSSKETRTVRLCWFLPAGERSASVLVSTCWRTQCVCAGFYLLENAVRLCWFLPAGERSASVLAFYLENDNAFPKAQGTLEMKRSREKEEVASAL
ncbi:hypothetical protein KUCAC02_003190, partial [Chaenocephalus aceratus]